MNHTTHHTEKGVEEIVGCIDVVIENAENCMILSSSSTNENNIRRNIIAPLFEVKKILAKEITSYTAQALQAERDRVREALGSDLSMPAPRMCAYYEDHQIGWDGNAFTCARCGHEFRDIKSFLALLTPKKP